MRSWIAQGERGEPGVPRMPNMSELVVESVREAADSIDSLDAYEAATDTASHSSDEIGEPARESMSSARLGIEECELRNPGRGRATVGGPRAGTPPPPPPPAVPAVAVVAVVEAVVVVDALFWTLGTVFTRMGASFAAPAPAPAPVPTVVVADVADDSALAAVPAMIVAVVCNSLFAPGRSSLSLPLIAVALPFAAALLLASLNEEFGSSVADLDRPTLLPPPHPLPLPPPPPPAASAGAEAESFDGDEDVGTVRS